MGAKKKWVKEDEEAEKYGHQPLFSDFTGERGCNWCRARVKVTLLVNVCSLLQRRRRCTRKW